MLTPGHGFRLDHALVADAAAAIVLGVGVDALAPFAWSRHPDAIVVAHHGREIANDKDGRRGIRLSQKSEHAVVGVTALNPFEACRVEILLVKRRRLAIERVQIADEALHSTMWGVFQMVPIKGAVM